MRRSAMVLLVAAALGGASCAPRSREELELLKKEDPEFETRVAAKLQADQEMAALRSELARHKSALDTQVGQLRTVYEGEAGRIGGQVKLLESKIDATRALYRTRISDLSRTLEAKKNRSRELRGAAKDLVELLGRRGPIGLSSSESRNWELKKEDLQKRIDELGTEIQNIESEIALKRRKLKYL